LLERHLDDVDVFVAMSEFSRAKHREFDFPREMVVLPYFLPDPPDADVSSTPAEAARPHDRPYFLFVGRLERIKGLDEVLHAFAGYDAADLLVVGDGEHGPVLRQMAAGTPRVRFVGRLPVDELSAYYRHAIAVLVPSICFETFGLTLIEAFSNTTPVIARRLGPFPEIVEVSGGGELFETSDEMLNAMRSLQQTPERRRQMGEAGYQAYRDRWSESAVVPRYLQIVDEARERRNTRRPECAPS
jgi:glycosyltransferase involved in cell wall biosynthesis